jgi:anti-sigma regulatory factor (Ser/Thr protein kinase)
MNAKVEMRLEGSMDHLRLAWQAGETLLASTPFQEDPDGTRYNVLLSVQEMVTNVLRHGYRGDHTQPLILRMEASPQGFGVEIRDRGQPFDPVAHEVPDPLGDEEQDEIEPGGYGIVIVRMVMDELEYRFEDGWNITRLFKSVCAPVGAEATEGRS